MVNFNFATAQRIVFGCGRLAELGALAAQYGKRVCLATGGKSFDALGRMEQVEALLKQAGLEWMRVRIGREPTVEDVDQAARAAREFGAEVVIGIGGGSVIDAGKAVAALLGNGGETMDYLEGVGRGKALTRPSAPYIAAPTTAGTGAEATKNAVITDSGKTFKKSMRSDGMLPAVALVDPELTYGCPRGVAAACGMDAMTQLIEAFTSRKGNPVTETLAGLGLAMAANLPKLFSRERDQGTHEALALASLLGGITLANAGLGAVHGLASPLGAFYPIPHGVVCATLLGPIVAANARRAAREGAGIVLDKYAAVAIQLIRMQQEDGIPEIPFEDAMDEAERRNPPLNAALSLACYLKALTRSLGIPGLGHYGVTPAEFPRILAASSGGNFQTNPVTLEQEELAQALTEAL